jgi:thiosulfate dehydrogenase
MMIPKRALFLVAATAIALGAVIAMRPASPHAQQTPVHDVPNAAHSGTVVMLCDGKTSIEVKNLKPGHSMTRAEAQAVSDELMAKWRKANPDTYWEVAQAASPGEASSPSGEYSPSAAASPATGNQGGASNAPAAAPSLTVQQGDTYASFQPRDYKVWKAETDDFVAEGKRIFHDAKALGSTIGVSCDMCHPDASNTHPETYPKYQVQLQKVALLRDMIDWCIENPIKGKALDPNDPKLRALEAYIYAQRKGVALDYGKH